MSRDEGFSYQDTIEKQQVPKIDGRSWRKRNPGKAFCKDCRDDFPIGNLIELRCPDCHEVFERNIKAHQKRIRQEEKVEIAAGRAFYDYQGRFIEK